MRIDRFPPIVTFAIFIAILFAFAVYEKPLSPEQRRNSAEAANGTNASVTAAVLVAAVRACSVVGVTDIDKCAHIQSPLLADQSAQIKAGLATSMRADYWKSCKKDFTAEYCGQLLQRAFDIEARKPMQ